MTEQPFTIKFDHEKEQCKTPEDMKKGLEDLKKVLEPMKEIAKVSAQLKWAQLKEIAEVSAQLKWAQYSELVKAGFSNPQALQLIKDGLKM